MAMPILPRYRSITRIVNAVQVTMVAVLKYQCPQVVMTNNYHVMFIVDVFVIILVSIIFKNVSTVCTGLDRSKDRIDQYV